MQQEQVAAMSKAKGEPLTYPPGGTSGGRSTPQSSKASAGTMAASQDADMKPANRR